MTTATDKITPAERAMIDAAPVTKVKAGKARGVNKRTAPMTATKPTRAQKRAAAPAATKRTRKAPAKRDTSKPVSAGNTFTTVELAAQHDMQPKTLRARIRRNIDAWEPLFKDGVKHVFADNKTTRAKVEALLS